MYIEETAGDDPVGNDPFPDEPFHDESLHGGTADGALDGGHVEGAPGGAGGSLLLDTPQGVRDVGPATEDTDGNGRPDTAVLDEGRDMLLVTDLDGDAAVDQTVRTDDTGTVTVSRHTGPGQWTVVEQRGVGEQAAPGAGSGTPDVAGDPVPPGGSAPSATDDEAWALGEPTAPQPEQPHPGQPGSGEPAPDQAAPDQAAPDQAAPDQAAPEEPIPARQPPGAARPDADAVWV